MKKLTLITIMLLLSFSLFAGGLNADAKSLKDGLPAVYDILKIAAIAEWPGDNTMILYKINSEATAMVNALNLLIETKEYDIFFQAVKTWSFDLKEPLNIKIYNEAEEYIDFCYLNVDWSMVLYTMKSEIEAKESY